MKYVFLSAEDIDKIYTGPRGGRYYLRKDEHGQEVKEYLDDEDAAKEALPANDEGPTDSSQQTSDSNSPKSAEAKPQQIDSKRLDTSLQDFDSVWNSMDETERQTLVDSLDGEKLSQASELLANASEEDREKIFDKALKVSVSNTSSVSGNNLPAPAEDNLPDLTNVEKNIRSSSPKTQKQNGVIKEACEKYLLGPKRRFFKNHATAISAVSNVAIMALVISAMYLGADFDPDEFGAESPLHNRFVEEQGEGAEDTDDYEDNQFIADDWDKAAREAREESEEDEDEDSASSQQDLR